MSHHCLLGLEYTHGQVSEERNQFASLSPSLSLHSWKIHSIYIAVVYKLPVIGEQEMQPNYWILIINFSHHET